MNVADLRQHLADLGKVLESAGAKKVADDLGAVSAGLAPFHNLTLKEFAAFLAKAEAFSRGEPAPKPAKRPASRGKTGDVSPDIDVLCRDFRSLYDRAADPSVTEEVIVATMGRLDGLSKSSLFAVALALELNLPKSKSIPQIVAAIHQRIVARKGSKQR